jgi:Xaa-Pro aminopeptidase
MIRRWRPLVDHRLRREHLVARLPELGVDTLLIARLPNVRYLTGFSGSNGQVLITAADAIFLTDSRYEEQARHEVPDLRRITYAPDLLGVFPDACRELSAHRVGFEAAGTTYKTYRRLVDAGDVELVPVDDVVERLRWAKDAEELTLIEQAQELADEAYERIAKKLVEGVTEREVALELEQSMRRAGADGIAFESIVAFGGNAAEPHHRPRDRPLRSGDIVKADFGCVVQGYHTDMTRTLGFGEPDGRLVEVYELVSRAQRAGIEAIRPGSRCDEVDEAARSVIRDGGYGERFGHSLGHGVGLEIHEGPTLRAGSTDVLPEGAVVTVEPGIYLPGVGGVRIEDVVVVEADGARALPRSSRELAVL